MATQRAIGDQDSASKYLVGRSEVIIKNTPETIWDYVYNPENWTASNADEHLGLAFFNRENRPATGTAFHQKEKVAGVFADLRGHILYVDPGSASGPEWRATDFSGSFHSRFQKMACYDWRHLLKGRGCRIPYSRGSLTRSWESSSYFS